MIHHEKFEFYGDRIISAINATQLLVNDYHSIGKIINIAGQNKVFICLMKNKNLCRGFFHNKPLRGKSCADTFEAIIGLLYWYLEKTYGSRFDTLQYVEQWLNSVWNFDKILSEVANNRPACIPKNKQIVPPEPLFSEPLTIWQSLRFSRFPPSLTNFRNLVLTHHFPVLEQISNKRIFLDMLYYLTNPWEMQRV